MALESIYPKTTSPFEQSPIHTEEYTVRRRGVDTILSYAKTLDVYAQRAKAGEAPDQKIVGEIVTDLRIALNGFLDKKRRGGILSPDEEKIERSVRHALRIGETLLGRGLASKPEKRNEDKTVYELIVEKMKKDFPGLTVIDFDNATETDVKLHVDSLMSAILVQVKKQFIDPTVSNQYPGEPLKILGRPLFAIESKVKSNPTLKDLIDSFPDRLAEYKNIFIQRLVSIEIHHDRALKFKEVFTSEEDKKIGKITAVYASMGDDTGGYRPYDMQGLYRRNLPDSKVADLGTSEDAYWQLGNIVNFSIAEIDKTIKRRPELNPFPWTERQGARSSLETIIKNSLSQFNLNPEQVELGIMLAFWDIRSAGMEFNYDTKGVDQRFSRIMRIKEWIKSATSSAAKRAYEYSDEIGKVFDRMIVTQEEFIHVTIVLPKDAVEVGSTASLTAQERTILSSRYAKDADIDTMVTVFRIKDTFQQWGGMNGGWIIVPKGFIRNGISAEPDTLQVQMRLSDIRKSGVDPKYIDWESITESVNAKYAFVADKMEGWFENYGTITQKEAGQKFFADARKMESAEFVPVEKAGDMFRSVRMRFIKGGLDWRKRKAIFGIGSSLQSGNSVRLGTKEIAERSEKAVELNRDLRGMIHVAMLDDRDFDQWGFKSFFHNPNDYMINKLKLVGAKFRKGKRPDGSYEYDDPTVTLELLRDMFRTRSGQNFPLLMEEAVISFESAKASGDKDGMDIALNKIQIELFKIALDLWLERYRYSTPSGEESPESFQIGSMREIETKSGRPPLDFIDIKTIVESVTQYSIYLASQMGVHGAKAPKNFPSETFIEDLMIEKGIIGTDSQVQIDLLSVSSKRFADVPERGKRQEENTASKK